MDKYDKDDKTEDEFKRKKRLLILPLCCVLTSAVLAVAAIGYFMYSEEEPIKEKTRVIPHPRIYKNLMPVSKPTFELSTTTSKILPTSTTTTSTTTTSTTTISTTTTSSMCPTSLVLITDKKNYSDAFQYCEQQKQLRLWIPESAEQETIFTEWIANTSDCNEAFLGHRFVLDKQWHPIGSPDGPYSFGDLSEMITCEDYDWGSEHCLRFETISTCANSLNNIPCTMTSSCYICQNRDGCLSSECLLLNTESLDYFQAKNKCLAEDQKLLFISNKNELIKLREIVKSKPNFDDCGDINLDLTTTPVYENYKEEEVQFLPSFFDFSVSGDFKIKEMCVIYDKTKKKLIRENCTTTHCFVCGCI